MHVKSNQHMREVCGLLIARPVAGKYPLPSVLPRCRREQIMLACTKDAAFIVHIGCQHDV